MTIEPDWITTGQVRPGAPFYPFPQTGAPEVFNTIDEGLDRTPIPLYALPSTDVEQENTVGVIVIYPQIV